MICLGPKTSEKPPPAASEMDGRALMVALVLAVMGMARSAAVVGGRQALLFCIGIAMGLVLYRTSFGFTGAWRKFLLQGEGAGLRAQMVMLAVAVCLFYPALADGQLLGHPAEGFVMPAGMNIVIGSFLFGIGMQLAGGCASGTLFTVGGGNVKMVLTLAFFVLGAALGTIFDPSWWLGLPSFGAYSFIQRWGLGPALVMNLSLFAAIFLGSLEIERRRNHRPMEQAVAFDWLRGPWPLLSGAVGLALLNYATLAISGHPWGITSGFMLWGAKGLGALGVDLSQSAYWHFQTERIAGSVWADETSVMDFGILIGAMLAAALLGRFKPSLALRGSDVLSAIVGGLLLGYGARLAFGCNIGALFSGIASGSLHGWLWLVFGFTGNAVGLRLQRWLDPPRAIPGTTRPPLVATGSGGRG